MFAYGKNMQLAISDKLRRTGLGIGAGVVFVIAAGFLLSALWIFLADNLDWGSLGASGAIGGGLVVIGLILLLMAKHERHRVPSTDDLKSEVGEHLSLLADQALTRATGAADQAFDRVSRKASQLMDEAEHKAHAVADDLSYRAHSFAEQAEARVFGTARGLKETVSSKVGLTPEMLDKAEGALSRAKDTNAAAIAPVVGAFAIGIMLASRVKKWRNSDHDDAFDDDDLIDDWDDDYDDPYYDDDLDRY